MDCTISSEGKQASGRKQDVGQEAAAKGSEEVFEEVDDIQLHTTTASSGSATSTAFCTGP